MCAGILAIGIHAWRSKTAVGFFTGQKPPKVKDIKKYNHAVAILWFVYALLVEAFGIPLLFYKQNSPAFLLTMFGTVAASFGLMIAYVFIEGKYKQ